MSGTGHGLTPQKKKKKLIFSSRVCHRTYIWFNAKSNQGLGIRHVKHKVTSKFQLATRLQKPSMQKQKTKKHRPQSYQQYFRKKSEEVGVSSQDLKSTIFSRTQVLK